MLTRGSSFLGALLRQGASVVAVTPEELPPEADDPEPLPALRRIGVLSSTGAGAQRDPLLVRATRYAVLLPLASRVFVLAVVWLWFVISFGTAASPLITVIAWIGIATSLASVLWVLRVPDRSGRFTCALLVADTVFALAACVVASLGVPPALYWPAAWVTFVYLTGAVALWTMVRGVPSGLALVVLGIALQVFTLWAGHPPQPSSMAVGNLVAWGGMLLVAVILAVLALVLVGLGTRLALAVGIRLGQTTERARSERMLHDTVLQALEAMAMSGAGDETDPRGQLLRVRQTARAQATELRRGLRAEEAPDGLAAELAALAAEMARDGLRAELAISDIGDDRLSEVRRVAVRDAAREALRNTMKHSGTTDVVVRMEERDGGVAVITRDHGAGYDENARPAGFGVSESMTARLTEVGGWCRIESWPGRGTRVTLWVPR